MCLASDQSLVYLNVSNSIHSRMKSIAYISFQYATPWLWREGNIGGSDNREPKPDPA
jgi:hypothetical protein